MFNITPIRPNYDKPAVQTQTVAETEAALRAAYQQFNARGQSSNASICADMANKLRKFGSFASEKQEAFARSLIERAAKLATPIAQATAPVIVVPEQRVHRLFGVMQRHSHFYLGDVTLARKNQDSLVWIKHAKFEGVVGKIVDAKVTLFDARLKNAGIDAAEIVALLDDIEADPLAAAMKFGKLSGRCCSCGRDLTDPVSIEAGIGPVCATKFE